MLVKIKRSPYPHPRHNPALAQGACRALGANAKSCSEELLHCGSDYLTNTVPIAVSVAETSLRFSLRYKHLNMAFGPFLVWPELRPHQLPQGPEHKPRNRHNLEF